MAGWVVIRTNNSEWNQNKSCVSKFWIIKLSLGSKCSRYSIDYQSSKSSVLDQIHFAVLFMHASNLHWIIPKYYKEALSLSSAAWNSLCSITLGEVDLLLWV